MEIKKLLKGLNYTLLCGSVEGEVSLLADKSSDCVENSMFFAIVGTKVNGEDYIEEAIKNGTRFIVVQNDISKKFENYKVSIIMVESVRKAISMLAKNFYCYDGYKFKLIGITGTNGKTTTSFVISDALSRQNYNVCTIGTNGVFVNNIQLRGEGLTTPDPIELQSLFGFCNEIHIEYVIMEVSAHALDLDKLYGVVFDFSIFSNLTQDHLDYFKTMENYGCAKQKLFSLEMSKVAVINSNDSFGEKLIETRKNGLVTYGENSCDYKITILNNNSFKLTHSNHTTRMKTNYSGVYNIYNVTSAVIVLMMLGLSEHYLKKYLTKLKKIDGRYNVFQIKNHGTVVLDFAHTPDGIEKLLNSVRVNMKNKGRLISVFGCGGNRDRKKRAIMGGISGKLADYTIISIDNPRFEDPWSVMRDIESGVREVTSKYQIVMPRSNAVLKAIEMSGPEDYVVVSGKGTEPYYEVNGRKEFYREDVVIDCIKKYLEK